MDTIKNTQCKIKYSTNLTMNDKFVDGVLGTRTWGCRGQVQANPLSYGGTPK